MPPRPRFQLIDDALFDRVAREAAASPRARQNHNFHRTLEENPNRLLNVLLPGSYITPHRHDEPPRPEAFLLLRGRVAFFLFDDAGQVSHAVVLQAPGGPHPVGIDVDPGVWHTLAALDAPAVCYEVKPGPYIATSDKEFAPWAPREGEAGCAAYLAGLLERVRPRAS